MVRIAEALAEQGMAAASIDHRLLHEDPEPSRHLAHLKDVLPGVSIPAAVVAAIEDTLDAVDYLNHRADDLGIDPGRLGLLGASTGAITAAHIAYALDDHAVTPPALRFIVSIWGGVFLDPFEIRAGDPPLFAVHGDLDEMMPVAMSDDLIARAERAGVPTEYHRLAGATHGFAGVGFFERPLLTEMLAFARRHL
jgi:acetyl esterase/lipase